MQVIVETLSRVKLGKKTVFKNLTMFPILDGGQGEPDYLTLDEALAQGLARVTEVSLAGHVPELKFVNEGAKRVLLLDGEELVGAKQNRVLNLTILAPAKKSLIIPVSCVESGRWMYDSPEFASAPRVHFARGRLEKTAQVSHFMMEYGERRSDQGAVWDAIAAKAARLRAYSPSHAMAAMYEKYDTTLNDYVRAFSAADGQVGAMFAINGKVIGFDLFDFAATLRKVLPKLVRSYALDAIDMNEGAAKAATPGDAQEFLSATAKAKAQTFPAVGVGEDKRLFGPGLTGAALVADGRVVHLCAFRLEGEGAADRESFAQGAMKRSSARRQAHSARREERGGQGTAR